MRYPDRSDSPSFYDPEHPLNRTMPTFDERQYWVEVLLDDGEQWGMGYWAENAEEAKDKAWQDALEHGFKPVQIESATVQP